MPFVFSKKVYLLVVLSVLTACASPLTNQKQAQFDAKNLHAIPISPYYIPDPRQERIDHAWALTVTAAAQEPFFGFLKPNRMLLDPLFDFFIDLNMKPGQSFHGEESYVSTNACKGEYRIQVIVQADGNLSGTIQYQDYSDNCSLSFNTSLPFRGKIDTSTGLMTLSLKPDDLVGRINSREYSISGELQLNMNVFLGPKQKYSAQVDLSFEDILGPEYRLKNMLLKWDETGQYSLFSMAGFVHFSQYGKVEISTDGFLVSYKKNGRPFDGILIFKGANESWLRLRFPKPTFPGFFKVDSLSGMRTKGNF